MATGRHSSARAVLMTLLGEYVLHHDRPMWTSVFVDALARLDIEEKSARQALSRTAAAGWLESEQVGRRARWSLSAAAREMLESGTRRIYGFGTDPTEWDGRWLVLLVSVPESRRDLRNQVRTRLAWAGLGSPEPGVWIAPDTAREPEVRRILAELGLTGSARSFTARYGGIGQQEQLVADAWDLRALAEGYAEFTGEFSAPVTDSGDAVWKAQTRLVHRWRAFPALDPCLPARLLPAGWPGAAALWLFQRRHEQWHEGAQRRWREILASHEEPGT
ncbi:PaaX family transcriptional regulator C-terminal domain-containing protein [Kutzneria albida]|uniref:Phenylacetic acid degradation operon negative regulatory protein PaaX n=1 Tax=Kutzneria albida DSM 43870 TaxID=1449976 RepID=W5W808_9PSEU|nr:PaaX family transcriptional regulator C-terminal domain-containing protein [Kutzneria albida]AHH96646.1 phenylacetic acid degradation operon negative regulatory protein PaaX [Kutzneria albida DSM 43870]